MAIGISCSETDYSTADQFFNLMDRATKLKLYVRLENHLNHKNEQVLLCKIFHMNVDFYKSLFSYFSTDKISVLVKAENFIRKYYINQENEKTKTEE